MSDEVRDFNSENFRFDAYLGGVISGEFDNKTQQEIADEIGVTPRTLWNWNQKIDWGVVRDERRKLYARHTASIDAALIRQANKGDTRAIELYFSRFDGFIPTNRTLNVNDIPDEELRKRAAELGSQINAKPTAGEGSVPLGAGEAGT